MYFAAVFSLFCCLAFLNLMTMPYEATWPTVFVNIVGVAGFALLYAWAGVTRRFWWMIIIVSLQAGFFIWASAKVPNGATLADVHSGLMNQLNLLGVFGRLTLLGGYVLFIVLMVGEGKRYFRVNAEIQLAQEIHRKLVPKIEQSIGRFTMYGESLPSGEVGGDLVDVIQSGSWTAYVADVSGHGVTAGVLMAMFKTAVRTTALADGSPSSLLNEVHRALYPLKTPNLFVTAGVLHRADDGQLTFALAGHPPILQYRKATGEVVEHAALDLPLGILPEQQFQYAEISAEAGDILVLLTDGMTEVFDAKKNEMGIAPVKAALRANAGLPLPQLFKAMRAVALGFGKQDDDQTMLLIRLD
ncbi:MAG TPA: PP2C family protein-serine/threonine phosphatase [Candidatus Koribacter sp.]